MQVFFSVYHYNLTSFISGPSPTGAGNLLELQAVFKRVLRAGLASLPEDFDEETLDVDRPGSPEETLTVLEYNDPRAVDFRNYLRTWYVNLPLSHEAGFHSLRVQVRQGTMVVNPSA